MPVSGITDIIDREKGQHLEKTAGSRPISGKQRPRALLKIPEELRCFLRVRLLCDIERPVVVPDELTGPFRALRVIAKTCQKIPRKPRPVLRMFLPGQATVIVQDKKEPQDLSGILELFLKVQDRLRAGLLIDLSGVIQRHANLPNMAVTVRVAPLLPLRH